MRIVNTWPKIKELIKLALKKLPSEKSNDSLAAHLEASWNEAFKNGMLIWIPKIRDKVLSLYENIESFLTVWDLSWLIVVVLGLVIELGANQRARHIDSRDNAALHRQAQEERLRADTMEINIRELTHVYGQSSNALVEATNVLSAAKSQLADAESKLAEAKAMIRPLKERLIDLLTEIDPRIMPTLRSGTTRVLGVVPENQFTRLKLLQSEPGSDELISSIEADPGVTMVGPKGSMFRLTMQFKPALAK
jgi:hypothetical protein